MSSYNNNNHHHRHPSVSFEDNAPTMDSDLMNGGPVGPFDGEYVNGHSTNGTTSPSTPGFHSLSHAHISDEPPRDANIPRKKLFSTEEEEDEDTNSFYPSSARADTWPGPHQPTPLANPNGTKRGGARGPLNGSSTRSRQHTSHPVPPPGPHEGGTGGPRSRTYARAATTDDARTAYPRISRPVELLRSSYDCVVIGSGYGGAVAASRAARAGEEVCLLELGKERWPGEYPIDSGSALDDLHCSGTVAPGGIFSGLNVDEGDPTGMYHLIFGKGQNAVVCNGESSSDD